MAPTVDSGTMPRFGYLLPTRGSVISSDDRQVLAAKTEADVIGLARRAETFGLSSVWVGDSVLAKPRHDPLTTLAAVASATEAIELGVVHLAALRHPAQVAHQTATVDQLSGGRLNWGVGVGLGEVVEAEYANLGIPFEERGARTDELLDIVTALWEGEPIDYHGEFYDLEDASIGFSPASHPRIYVATFGFEAPDGPPRPVKDRLVAHGSGWIPIGLSPGEYEESLSAVKSALADAGRSSDALDTALYLDLAIGDDDEDALDTAREFYEAYYTAWDHPMSDEEVREHGEFGSAETVAESIEAYADAGVETFVVRFTSTDQREQLQRLADLVR